MFEKKTDKERLEEIENKLKVFSRGGKKYQDLIDQLIEEKNQIEQRLALQVEIQDKEPEKEHVHVDSYLSNLYDQLAEEMKRVQFFANRGEINDIGNLSMNKIKSLYERVQTRELMYKRVYGAYPKELRPDILKGLDAMLSNEEQPEPQDNDNEGAEE